MGLRKMAITIKYIKKWFGETFIDKSLQFKKLLYISLLLLFIISTIAIVNLYWNRKLKLKVDNRTEELGKLNEELIAQTHKFEKKQ